MCVSLVVKVIYSRDDGWSREACWSGAIMGAWRDQSHSLDYLANSPERSSLRAFVMSSLTNAPVNKREGIRFALPPPTVALGPISPVWVDWSAVFGARRNWSCGGNLRPDGRRPCVDLGA